MHKNFNLLLLLLFSTISFGQTITLTGKITDPDDQPLEAATVYLTSVKDSTVIDYTISAKNGIWEIRTRKITQPVFLKVSFLGYSDFRQEFTSLEADRDFGTQKLADKSTELGEVVIEGEIPPIRIKQDTLEFNASSFKVRPDANVEALLKQLPGVDIDQEGKITVNGKEVNQVLVNGKPFFDADGKIALQNLPAEIINKVQVTDTKTKKEEISGQAATGNNASINLTIDEDKNKGLFGKFMGGYGSDDRYESSALLNYFKGKTKFSVLGSSNNINTTGFSMNEIFDSMGGGRNMSVYTGSDGSFGINGMQFGGNSGITRSNILGLNYADEWAKGLDASGNYFYSDADTENRNRTRQVTFLPEDDDANPDGIERSLTTVSSSSTDSYKYAHNFNSEFQFKIDSTSTVYYMPKFVKAHSEVRTNSEQVTTNQDERLLNESSGLGVNENDNTSFSSSLDYYKSFAKKGREISFSFNNENRVDDGANLNRSTTLFYEDPDGDGIDTVTPDIRDQIRYNRQTRDNYTAEIEYSEPITDSLSIRAGLTYNWDQSLEDREGFDIDPLTGEYTVLNPFLTNYLSSKTSSFGPVAGITIRKNKWNFRLDGGPEVAQLDNYSLYLGENTKLKRNYILPSVRANISYRFTKSKSLWASYNYNTNFPQARQLLPVEDLSNPLFTYMGNPDLDPNLYHNVYLSFRDYDFATRSGYSFYAGGNYYNNQVISSTFINDSGKRFTSYENISGTYNGWFGASWNKSLKKEAHTFKFNLGLSSNFGLDKNYTNARLTEARRISLSPRVNLTWDYGELLNISPSYNYTYSQTNYTNYNITEASNFVHRINLQTTSYWPKNFVFGNDFGYNYNSQIADGFKKDFYLWNTSLGYNFYKDKLMFKVKVYDVLNQNLGTSRTISATSIRDEENIVLRRYVMFSLTFKIKQFGGKESKEGNSRFWMW